MPGERFQVVSMVTFVVDASVPVGAYARHDGHTSRSGVVGHAFGRLDATVRIAEESPDDDSLHAQASRQVGEPAIILKVRVWLLQVCVVATKVENARIIEHPVGAMVPRPEVRVGQRRLGARQLPGRRVRERGRLGLDGFGRMRWQSGHSGADAARSETHQYIAASHGEPFLCRSLFSLFQNQVS